MDWNLNMDQAPKDGSKVLVSYEGEVFIARFGALWHPDNVMWLTDQPFSDPPTVSPLGPERDTDGIQQPWHRTGPTKWMPLPDA
ncbi:MAG TPA: hypothetical protein PKD48_02080 [Sphingopyxis sp.]|nr:hypothetical protein [Sphingopyxis sp.]